MTVRNRVVRALDNARRYDPALRALITGTGEQALRCRSARFQSWTAMRAARSERQPQCAGLPGYGRHSAESRTAACGRSAPRSTPSARQLSTCVWWPRRWPHLTGSTTPITTYCADCGSARRQHPSNAAATASSAGFQDRRFDVPRSRHRGDPTSPLNVPLIPGIDLAVSISEIGQLTYVWSLYGGLSITMPCGLLPESGMPVETRTRVVANARPPEATRGQIRSSLSMRDTLREPLGRGMTRFGFEIN